MAASMRAPTVDAELETRLSETLMMQPDPLDCKGFLKTVMKRIRFCTEKIQ